MKKNDYRFSRFLFLSVLLLMTYISGSACTCPPEGTGCTTPPNFNITVCNVDVIEVTFFNYTTFGSSPGQFCACGFNMPPEITEVLDVTIINASTGIPLSGFAFTQNSTTATEFNNLMAGSWEGFSSAVTSNITVGLNINIVFTVRVTSCDPMTLQGAIASLNAIGTGGATAGGVPNSHVCLPPPPVLPVELSYFEGFALKKEVQLSWKSLSERNNDYFSIERSENGIDFKEIARIKGAGTSIASNEYTYIDKTPSTGINYYRLKQVDFDGVFEYFKIVSVEILSNNDSKLLVFPNPVQNDEVNLQFPEMDAQGTVITIYNVAGKLMHTQFSESNKIKLNVEHLPRGVYLFTVKRDESTFWEKVIVN